MCFPGDVTFVFKGVEYSGLKKGSFNLAPVYSLKSYRNAPGVCDYLVQLVPVSQNMLPKYGNI